MVKIMAKGTMAKRFQIGFNYLGSVKILRLRTRIRERFKPAWMLSGVKNTSVYFLMGIMRANDKNESQNEFTKSEKQVSKLSNVGEKDSSRQWRNRGV